MTTGKALCRKRMMLAVAAMAGVAVADTVALWPMENGNMRCAIDPRNDLVASGMGYIDQTIGWNLPPNADSNVTDATTYLFAPVSRTCVHHAGTWNFMRCSTSGPLETALDTTAGTDFTIEGFFKWAALPVEGSNRPKILCNSFGSTGNPSGGWQLSCWHSPDDEAFKWRLEGNGWGLEFDAMTAAEAIAITNSWNHFALVFRHDGQSNAATSDWTLYLNGISKGTVNRRFATCSRPSGSPVLHIGRHQSTGDDRAGLGDFDYWRVSNEALGPTQFLNYDPQGKGGATVPEVAATPERTVAYWKFNCTDGVVDVRDYAGEAHMSSLQPNNCGVNGASVMLLPSEECAFEGDPPNSTVSFASGNHGSFLAPNTRLCCLTVTNNALGAQLDVTNAFTVEGWFKPRRRTGSDYNAQGWMFGNMPAAAYRGWMVGTLVESGRRYLSLFAANYSGSTRTYLQDRSVAANYRFCDVTDWGEEWRHIALTYDPAGGEAGIGEWNLYMDGILAGTVTNSVAPAETTKPSSNFYIGGAYNGSFSGLYDAIRVSRGVLSPKQFLCCADADAQAATGVIATWPLNVTAGTGLGGANLEGGYNLFGRDTDFPEGYYLLFGSDTAPNATIPNPDTSRVFDGTAAEAATNVGSVAFCAGANHDFAWLATCDQTVIDTLKGEDGWTLEGFVRYDTTNGSLQWTGFGPVFALASSLDQSKTLYRLNVYNKTGYTGRYLYQTGDPFGTISDEPKTVQLGDKTWHHLAVCHSYYMGEGDVKMSRLGYYLDGSLVTNIDTVARATANIAWLIFGSNTNGSRGFPGMVNSWRLSRGVLSPSEFLNATAAATEPVAPEKKTVAYWPLDGTDEGPVDVEVASGVTGYALYLQPEEGVTGSVAVARSSVPNDGVAFSRSNSGSALVSDGGYLRADYLGGKVDLDAAWTVEGWFLRGAGAAAKRVLAGTSDATAGWTLFVDDTAEEPVFRLRATPAGCTPIADGVIPNAAGLAVNWNDWVHVALSFDPAEGKGTWTLMVNGSRYGSLENSWRNLALTAGSAFFTLGASPSGTDATFLGNLDMWRVSAGLLDADDLLYRPIRSTIIIFR